MWVLKDSFQDPKQLNKSALIPYILYSTNDDYSDSLCFFSKWKCSIFTKPKGSLSGYLKTAKGNILWGCK